MVFFFIFFLLGPKDLIVTFKKSCFSCSPLSSFAKTSSLLIILSFSPLISTNIGNLAAPIDSIGAPSLILPFENIGILQSLIFSICSSSSINVVPAGPPSFPVPESSGETGDT
ncbi:hypothetical protein HanIR_Chr02g0055941 [Helianthus annuus]|nr:hypothetical protein HanIR_Chr02g0055941 [Helianthus annuus]